VVMCDGGQLPCKSVIHVQYPPTHLTTTHDDHLSYKESAALKFCIVNILATCMKPKYNFISVALPVISSYSNRQKMADSMRHIAEALRECVEVIKSLSVRHIVLVAHGTDNLKLLVEQLHLVFATDPKTKFNVVDVDRCVTINDCCVSLMTGDLLKMKVGYFTEVNGKLLYSISTVVLQVHVYCTLLGRCYCGGYTLEQGLDTWWTGY
jgi:hypothetical protein